MIVVISSHKTSIYIKMSVKGIFVVMTFSVMAWKSLGLKWTTEALHTNCCEGENKILMWSCSLEKNETVQDYRWYFQSTQIAYVSESGKFVVHDLYKGRLEQIGKMVILLKNVSSVDTGNYSLYLNLGPEPPANMQTIFLTVFESPTYQCKPSITKYPENVLFCSTNSCGGTQLSTEWRISEKYDFVSNASYLKINSSWNAEHVSCCLHRQNMQCQNGNLLDFCAWTIILFAEDKHAPDSKYTENSMNLTPVHTIVIVIVLATTTGLSIVAVVICFIYRNKRIKLGRTFETSREFHYSESVSHRSEGITSETSRTIHYFETGSRQNEVLGRTSWTSLSIHTSETGSHQGEGKSETADARSSLSEGSPISHLNEDSATNSLR